MYCPCRLFCLVSERLLQKHTRFLTSELERLDRAIISLCSSPADGMQFYVISVVV